jgi:hypothetical protein
VETITLDEVVNMIHEINESCVKEISPLKLKTILFFAQIEFYTLYGVKLFNNDIRCYYNDISIEGLNQIVINWITQDHTLIYDLLVGFVEDFEDESEEELISILYQSKAFLKANMARGHRLTNKVLAEYHHIDQFFESISQISHNANIDEVMLNYQFVDEIIDDLEIFN